MRYIKLQKVGAAENPEFPTPLMNEYVPGQDNGPVSLPIDYAVTGHLQYEPKVGLPLIVNRDSRNGVQVSGVLATSLVTRVEGNQVWTGNSCYIIENARQMLV